MKNLLPVWFLVFFVISCVHDDDVPGNGIPFDGTGYKPVYATPKELDNITVTAGVPLKDPGKIYLLEPYIFVNERGKGVHVIDNSDPRKPDNIAFISIPGNQDMAAKGNWLYVDNISNLLVFDISDPRQPKLSKRIADAITVVDYPPFQNTYFECVDKKNGTVIGWEKVPMTARPDCYR